MARVIRIRAGRTVQIVSTVWASRRTRDVNFFWRRERMAQATTVITRVIIIMAWSWRSIRRCMEGEAAS